MGLDDRKQSHRAKAAEKWAKGHFIWASVLSRAWHNLGEWGVGM